MIALHMGQGQRCWLYPASVRPSLGCLLCEGGELGGLCRGPQTRRTRRVSVMGTGTALPYVRRGWEEKTWFSERLRATARKATPAL